MKPAIKWNRFLKTLCYDNNHKKLTLSEKQPAILLPSQVYGLIDFINVRIAAAGGIKPWLHS